MSELTWNFGFTRQLLFKKIRSRHFEATASLSSVLERMHHARYHFHQVSTPWTELLAKAENPFERLRILGWRATDEERDQQREEAIKRSANIVACVHALHAVPDTFAFALYHCLEMPKRENESGINVTSVCKWLESQPGAEAFRDVLNELVASKSYAHLSALSNHAKHRSIIEDKVFSDATGTDPVPLRLTFGEFSYKDVVYTKQEALPLLQTEFDRINPIVISAGGLINAYLSSRPDSL